MNLQVVLSRGSHRCFREPRHGGEQRSGFCKLRDQRGHHENPEKGCGGLGV